jgi:hypothetical protein
MGTNIVMLMHKGITVIGGEGYAMEIPGREN